MPARIKEAYLILCFTPYLGSATFARILRECKLRGLSPEQLIGMEEKVLRNEFGLPERSARALSSGANEAKRRTDEFLKAVEGRPVRMITRDSPIYPQNLERFCTSPPGYLFLYGNERLLENPTFCVLASRDASEKELRKASRIVEGEILAGKTLVTGADNKPYRTAALVPLRWGAPRIVVLDRGLVQALGQNLDKELFSAARVWRKRFDPEVDLVISFGRPDEGASKSALARRDEIVVALSEDVHAVRIRTGGTMEKLAARAESKGKRVFR